MVFVELGLGLPIASKLNEAAVHPKVMPLLGEVSTLGAVDFDPGKVSAEVHEAVVCAALGEV